MSTPIPTLAQALATERDQVIAALTDDEITAYAAVDPAFRQGGFRPGHTAPIRQRLRVLAAAEGELAEPLRRLLARRSLNQSLIIRLSETAITELRNELAALFGQARLLLALQLDEREALRTAAARWLTAATPFRKVAPATAVERLRDALGALFDACGVKGAIDAPPTLEKWRDEQVRLNDQLREFRTQLRALKGAETRADRFREQADLLKRERDALHVELKRATAEVRQAARVHEELKVELAREIKQREERVRAMIDTRLADEFAGWIAHTRSLETEVINGTDASSDLLKQAEHALRRQAAADRHSGNRATLLARLDALADARRRVGDVLAHALVQTPELPAVARALDEEMARIRVLLEIEMPATSLEKTLLARLHSADGNDLYAIRTLIERLESFAAFDAAACKRLNAALTRRQAALLARGDIPEGNAPEPVLALRRALTGRGKAILLVDGHNLLFALQGRYMPASGAAVPDREKRARMVADFVRLAGPHPTCRVWIVFDGPVSNEESPFPNVRVSYSGGVGEHRADAVLLDDIRFLRGVDETIPIILASNDNALCGQARRLGAFTVAATDIGALL